MNATMIGVLPATPGPETARGGARDPDPEAFAVALGDAVTSAATSDEVASPDRARADVARDRSPAEDAVRSREATRPDDPTRTSPTAGGDDELADDDTPPAGPAAEVSTTTTAAALAAVAGVPTESVPSVATTGEEPVPAQPAAEVVGATTVPEAVGRGRTEAAAFRARLTGVPGSSTDAAVDHTGAAPRTATPDADALVAGPTSAAGITTTATTTTDAHTPAPTETAAEVVAGTAPTHSVTPAAAATAPGTPTGTDPTTPPSVASGAAVPTAGGTPAEPVAVTAPGEDPDASTSAGTPGGGGDVSVMSAEPSVDPQPGTASDGDGQVMPTPAQAIAAEPERSPTTGETALPGEDPGAATPADAASAVRSPAAPADVTARRPVAIAPPVTPTVAQHDQARPTAASQVATAVAALQRRGEGEYVATLDLHPSELGRVRVEVQIRAGVVNVALSAEQQGTRSLFSQQVGDLRAALEQGGMSAGDLDVSQQAFGRDDGRQRDSSSSRDGATGSRVPFSPTAQIMAASADLDMTDVPLSGLDVRL